uniref:Uncharacterized protein LOC104249532 n=1 Tax=Nicotiana sylvestris TaxID=4096 RepID=A0A1U7YYQ0_NICSY|nr:PREDICTED: uncharacterized protein LOC104249532 [Nicotiana sylvestris]
MNLQKKFCGAWSDEEESDHTEIANMCFMDIKDDSNEESRERGFTRNKGAYEEEDLGELGLMVDEGTSEVRLPTCPNCYKLQDFVNIAPADIKRVINELRKIQKEKKDWALKLEVCEIECDMLQEEVNELQLQLNGLQKSTSHSSEYHKKNRKGKWYLDSACSRHMTGDKQLFKTVTKLGGGTITFGNKSKGNVIGVGKFPLNSTCDLDEVYLVDELYYNLLSINQLCDNDYEVRFKKHGWFIEDESGITTRRSQKLKSHVALISQLEPKKVDEAMKDVHWIKAMKDELDQFKRNKVWELVPKPLNSSIVGTKWVFRNKLNESGQVVQNKARLVVQGYSQQEGIDYDETFAH